MLEDGSLQEKPCRSGCEGKMDSRLFLCSRCHRRVLICRRCDRGQLYCGHDCALEVRRSRQREARRRYQAGARGREMHAERSRRYRARGRRVTDQGPKLATKPPQPPEPAHANALRTQPMIINRSLRTTICIRCGQPVSDFVRLAPIRRPGRRPIGSLSGRPASRQRRITTDPDRR